MRHIFSMFHVEIALLKLKVWEHAYQKAFIVQGYEAVGLKHMSTLNRNKLLIERAPQLLKSYVKKEEVALETDEGKAILTGPYSMPATVQSCQECGKMTPTHLPHCGHCGKPSGCFSIAAAAVSKGGKSSGYSKQNDVYDVQKAIAEIPEEKRSERYGFMGDLLTEMRSRKRKADGRAGMV